MKLYQDEIMFNFVGEPLAPLAPSSGQYKNQLVGVEHPSYGQCSGLRHLLTHNFLQHNKIKELIQRWLYCGILEAKILVGQFLVKLLVNGQGNGVWTLLNVSWIGHSLSKKYYKIWNTTRNCFLKGNYLIGPTFWMLFIQIQRENWSVFLFFYRME